MNVTTRETVRFWAPTALVGLVSTAGVSLVLTAVVSAPAYSRPVPYEPPPTSSSAGWDQDRHQSRPITRNCFMFHRGWRAYESPLPPQCTVEERVASFPPLTP
jgi:hypothetical protein